MRETNLVIACAEDKLSVRVLVQNTLDDLPLVDRYRADLEVLLSNEHCERQAQRTQRLIKWEATIPSIGRLCARLFSSRS
jgi:hypothetical protein